MPEEGLDETLLRDRIRKIHARETAQIFFRRSI
jgi:hypothetical protein